METQNFGMKNSNGKQMLETRQMWKLKFTKPKPRMEARYTFGNKTNLQTPNCKP